MLNINAAIDKAVKNIQDFFIDVENRLNALENRIAFIEANANNDNCRITALEENAHIPCEHCDCDIIDFERILAISRAATNYINVCTCVDEVVIEKSNSDLLKKWLILYKLIKETT